MAGKAKSVYLTINPKAHLKLCSVEYFLMLKHTMIMLNQMSSEPNGLLKSLTL